MPLVPDQAAEGLDISNWQGSIDHARAAAALRGGERFVYCKATEGTSYVDPTYRRNVDGFAGRALRGAYHFGRPSGGDADARAEARHFAARGVADLELPPCLDLEATALGPTGTARWCEVFLAELTRLTGRTPIVYTAAWFTRSNGIASARIGGYPLWVAGWPAGRTRNPDPNTLPWPTVPAPWSTWAIWQYTSSGVVPGIAGLVDRNVGIRSWLADQTGQTPTAPDDQEEPAVDQETKDAIARIDLLVQVLGKALIPEGVNVWQPAGHASTGVPASQPVSNLYRWLLEIVLLTRTDDVDPEQLAQRVAAIVGDHVVPAIEEAIDGAQAQATEDITDALLDAVGSGRELTREEIARAVHNGLAEVRIAVEDAPARVTGELVGEQG